MEWLNLLASLVTLAFFLRPAARRVHRMLVPPSPTTLGPVAPPGEPRASDFILTELYRCLNLRLVDLPGRPIALSMHKV